MLMLACEAANLIDLGFCDITMEYPAKSFSLVMHLEHYLGRLFPRFGKKLLQHDYDKVHGGEIVIK